MTTADHYLARFQKVFEYIDARPDETLTVAELAGVAGFSKYHFHRQFAALFGIGVAGYIRLLRLKRASLQLAFRDASPVIDIALDSGYESPEAFARAFKSRFGQTPSDFRDAPDWPRWYDTCKSLNEMRKTPMNQPAQAVEIVNFPETRIAVLEHRGDPRLIGDTVRKFIEWRKENRLHPSKSATFNLVYDDPAETAPEDYRFDVCAAIDRPVAENGFGVVQKVIPGGRCAVLRHVGASEAIGETVSRLYFEWLPQSGETLRDFPMFFQRVAFFPDVPEHEAVTDVFLPLA